MKDYKIAEKQFWANVHDLLIISSKDKYKIIYRSKNTSNTVERVFLSKKEKKIVKIIIDPSHTSKDPVLRIHAEDEHFKDTIMTFQSTKDILTKVEEAREIVSQDRMMVKLKYNL